MEKPIFRADEALGMAVQIEEQGLAFYKACREAKIVDSRIEKVLDYLIDQEIRHKKAFSRMKSDLESRPLPESYPGEMRSYLDSFVKDRVFDEIGAGAEDALDLTTRLLESGIEPEAEQAEFEVCAGRGVGAVEAPRGTLFHDYEYDGQGRCTSANLLIPTAQNMANLEADLKAYLSELGEADEQTLTRHLEMLVRAYDPCISCSSH